MTTTKFSELKSYDVKRIDAMFEQHGMGPKGVGIVSRAFSITESEAGALATVFKERDARAATGSAGTSKEAITESTTPDVATDPYAGRKAALAVKLQMEAEAASVKPISECSIQELGALAAAAGAEAGMFGA